MTKRPKFTRSEEVALAHGYPSQLKRMASRMRYEAQLAVLDDKNARSNELLRRAAWFEKEADKAQPD